MSKIRKPRSKDGAYGSIKFTKTGILMNRNGKPLTEHNPRITKDNYHYKLY